MSPSPRLLPLLFSLWATLAACNVSDPGVGPSDVDAENNGGSDPCSSADPECEAPCATPTPYFEDRDQDGYGDPTAAKEACDDPPPGHVRDDRDCDDDDAEVSPAATELCNGRDDDCDGSLDEGCDEFVDGDGDGYCGSLPEAGPAPEQCRHEELDCDDASAEIFPGAPQRCGAIDADCDGEDPAAQLDALSILRGPVSAMENHEVTARRNDSFGVAWLAAGQENTVVRFTLLDTNGELESVPVEISHPRYRASSPQLVYDPGADRFVVAFLAREPQLGQGLYVARIDGNGQIDGESARLTDTDGIAVRAVTAGDGKVGLVYDHYGAQGESVASYLRVDVASLTAEPARVVGQGVPVAGASLAYSAEPSVREGTLALVRTSYDSARSPSRHYTFLSFHADDGSLRQPFTALDVGGLATQSAHLLSIDDGLFLTYRTTAPGMQRLHIAPLNPATGQLISPGTTLASDLQWTTSPVAFGRESADIFGIVYPSDASTLRALRLDRSAGWSVVSDTTFAESSLRAEAISPLYFANDQVHLLDRDANVGLFKWIRFHGRFGYGFTKEPITPPIQASALETTWSDARSGPEGIEVLQRDEDQLEVYGVGLNGAITAAPVARATARNDCHAYRFSGDTISCATITLNSGACAPSRRHAVVRHSWDASLTTWSTATVGQLPDAIYAGGNCIPPAALAAGFHDGDDTVVPYQSAIDGASEYRRRNAVAVFGPGGALLGDHTIVEANEELASVYSVFARGVASIGHVSMHEIFSAGSAEFFFGIVGTDGSAVAPSAEIASLSGWALDTRPWISGIGYAEGYYIVGIGRSAPAGAESTTALYFFDAATGAQVGEALEVSPSLRQVKVAGVDGMVVVSGIQDGRPVALTLDPGLPSILARSGADYTTGFVGQSFLHVDEAGVSLLFADSGGRIIFLGGSCEAPAASDL